MLAMTPTLARHVQKLTVHPERVLAEHERSGRHHVWNHAPVVSCLIAEAASHMDALHTFSWDGDDVLPTDRMWAKLRKK